MLKGTIIYQTDSTMGQIIVAENKTQRWLAFDTEYVQTIIDKQEPYLPLLRYLPGMCCILENTKDKVLLFGTGGGGFIHYVKHYYRAHPVLAIEISEEMIHIAQTFFDMQHPITRACAYNYIQTCDRVSHIMIDLLTKARIPSKLQDKVFYEQCKAKATKTVTFNLITQEDEDTNYLLTLIRDVFESHTLCLPVKTKKNMVVHAFLNKDYLNKIETLSKNNIIKPPIWDPHYGIISEVIIPL